MKKIVKLLCVLCLMFNFNYPISTISAQEAVEIIDKVNMDDKSFIDHEKNQNVEQAYINEFYLDLNNHDLGNITYRVKNNDQWSEWLENGTEVSNQSITSDAQEASILEFDGLEVVLTDTLKELYDVKYRVYNVKLGWSEWVSNGKTASFEDESDIQDYEISLVEKTIVEDDQNTTTDIETEEEVKDQENSSNETTAPQEENETAVQSEESEEAVVTSEEKAVQPTITSQGHVAELGWQNTQTNTSFVVGTTGKTLGLEAIKLKMNNCSGGIEYQTHVAYVGWQNKVSNNAMAGTTGKSQSIEAIKINLTGEVANQYDVYYRAHVAYIGWLPWTKNGNIAGSTGQNRNLEAVEIKLVKKGTAGPTTSEGAYLYDVDYTFYGHVEYQGWKDAVGNNGVIGTTGKSLRLEAIELSVSDPTVSGNIEYRTHVAYQGWQGWVKNGQQSGTTGKSLSIEAVQIRLTGGLAEKYDIYYRAHVAEIGWMAWTKKGEAAGTEGYGTQLEAIQIKIVRKGTGGIDTSGTAFKKYTNTPPTISNVRITNQDNTGYTVTAQVSSQNGISHVSFATWSFNNGQDDIVWKSGTISGNTVTFRVNASDHNYESGYYATHIYAYDKNGLSSMALAPDVNLTVNTFVKGQYKDLKKGVDISQWQAGLNLANIKNEIDYAILRIGYTGSVSKQPTLDPYFKTFKNQAVTNNIPIGVYYYSMATTVDKAVEEANFVIKTLKENNVNVTYPVFIDFEDPTQANLSASQKEAICNAFCMKIKEAGYKAGVYSRENFLFYGTTVEFDQRWELWVSHYGTNDGQPTGDIYKFKPYYDMWQYTSVGHLSGYSGNLDLNVGYTSY